MIEQWKNTVPVPYVACSKSIQPMAGKNTFTRLEDCNPNRLWSSFLVTEHFSQRFCHCSKHFWNAPLWMEYSLAIVFHIMSSHDSNPSPFQLRFQVEEQPKISRSHVRKVGNLSNHRNVVFGQQGLNQLWGMSWCVVMMQLPHSCCPQVWTLALHSITKAIKELQVVFFVNVLALWCVLVTHHHTGVKENGQHHFDIAPHLPGLFWPWGCWIFPLWWLHLGFWVIPVNPRLITSGHNVQEFRVMVCRVQHVL